MHLSTFAAALAGALIATRAPAAPPPPAPAFSAVEVLTTDIGRFEREQGKPVTDADLADFPKVGHHLGAVSIVAYFKNCRAGADGRCHVKALFSLTEPDGLIKGPVPLVMWEEAPGPAGVLMRPRSAPTLGFDAHDRAGVYRVAMAVTDEVSGATVNLVREVTYSG